MIKIRRFHNYKESYSIWDDISNWCFKNYGIPNTSGEWDYLADVGWMDFYFRNEQAAEIFILKWM